MSNSLDYIQHVAVYSASGAGDPGETDLPPLAHEPVHSRLAPVSGMPESGMPGSLASLVPLGGLHPEADMKINGAIRTIKPQAPANAAGEPSCH